MQKELNTSRRQWLKDMHSDQFASMLIEAWKQNITALVPDPTTANKSDYTEHARWLGVVKELNPIAYQELLAHWKAVHKRRRNLWKALQQQGLT